MAGSQDLPGIEIYRILWRGSFSVTIYTDHPAGRLHHRYWAQTAHGQPLGEAAATPGKPILVARRYLRAVTDPSTPEPHSAPRPWVAALPRCHTIEPHGFAERLHSA